MGPKFAAKMHKSLQKINTFQTELEYDQLLFFVLPLFFLKFMLASFESMCTDL